jgi:hypothetical protein
MLSTVAALAESDAVVSSWKLESSSTQRSGFPGILAAHQCVEDGGSDVPGDLAVAPRGPSHRSDQRGHGGLPVGAGNRDDPRALAHRLREQFGIAEHARSGREGTLHVRLGEGQTGADRDQVHAVETLPPKRAARGGNRRKRGSECRELRRLGARVGDTHVRSDSREPLRHRQTRVWSRAPAPFCPQNSHNFNVERPNSTKHHGDDQSGTTWGLFHPDIVVMVKRRPFGKCAPRSI